MTVSPLNVAMRNAGFLQAFMEVCAAGFEDVSCADINGIALRGISRHLLVLHDGREESHRADTIGPEVGNIDCHACSVAEAGGISGRDTVGRIDHVNEVAQGVFYSVFAP